MPLNAVWETLAVVTPSHHGSRTKPSLFKAQLWQRGSDFARTISGQVDVECTVGSSAWRGPHCPVWRPTVKGHIWAARMVIQSWEEQLRSFRLIPSSETTYHKDLRSSNQSYTQLWCTRKQQVVCPAWEMSCWRRATQGARSLPHFVGFNSQHSKCQCPPWELVPAPKPCPVVTSTHQPSPQSLQSVAPV